MAANDRGDCPYVFAGDAILYHLAKACIPTAYAFPSTLAYLCYNRGVELIGANRSAPFYHLIPVFGSALA